MKKIKLDGKLKLNKETIAKLNDEQMSSAKGGAAFTFFCTTTLFTGSAVCYTKVDCNFTAKCIA